MTRHLREFSPQTMHGPESDIVPGKTCGRTGLSSRVSYLRDLSTRQYRAHPRAYRARDAIDFVVRGVCSLENPSYGVTAYFVNKVMQWELGPGRATAYTSRYSPRYLEGRTREALIPNTAAPRAVTEVEHDLVDSRDTL